MPTGSDPVVYYLFSFSFLQPIPIWCISLSQKQSSGGFYKKDILKNFAKFTGKHLCLSLFFRKVAGLRLWHRYFPANFSKFLRTPFVTEHLRWLLLKTTVNQPIFREKLVDLQLYYSRTFSQEVFKHMCFKHFTARKYYHGRTSANENVRKWHV